MLGHRTLNMDDYLVMLKRRWWIVAIPTIILPIVAVGLTFVIPPTYESQSLVIIDPQKVPDEFVRPIVNEDMQARVATMNEQVLSRSTLQPIVDKYNLYGDQRLDMDARIAKVAQQDITLEAIKSSSHSRDMPGFKIYFKASDPHTAQQVCAELTSFFTSEYLRGHQDAAAGTTSFIKERLAQAKQALDEQDAKLAAFQREHFGMLPDDQTNNVGLMNSLQAQLDATTVQLQNLNQNETMVNAALAMQSAQPSAAGSSPLQTPQAEQKQLDDLMTAKDDLITRGYTDDYPAVKTVNRKIAELQAQMAKEAAAPPPVAPVPATAAPNRADSASVQQLRTQLAGIRQAIQDKRKQQEKYGQELASYEARIQSSPQVAEEEKELTRDYTTTNQNYQTLLLESQKADESADLESRQGGEQFTVLDPANLPEAPISPKQSIYAAGGLACGAMLGLVVVALLEYRDTALRTERDVWAFTQLPTLAVIAWSAGMEEKHARTGWLKRRFSRKRPKDLAADAAG